MSDLIKRKDVLREIDEWIQCGSDRDDDIVISEFLSFLKGDIDSIPSAERKGEWEIVGRKYFRRICPFCKRPRAFRDSRFCDWCGADMRGEGDGR